MSSGSASADVRRTKKIIGAIGIVFVAVFGILLAIRIFNLIDFFIGDLVVYLTANYMFRRLDRQNKP